ncbi:MAG: MarP family serine protease [Thermoleophilaceae bacterium]
MTALDWIIVAFTLLMAVWGYAQGLIVGLLALVGFVGGGFLGSRVGPLILTDGAKSPYAPVFALAGAFLLGTIFASGLEAVGFGVRRRFGQAIGVVDGLGGAVLIAGAGLGLCWIAGAVALQTPGASALRRDIQRSTILAALNRELPPSGALLHALARVDPFPRISGPAPGVAPPNGSTARAPGVRAAQRSVVRVLGTACGLGIEGSGWIARGGVVVTNAHVVAGETDTTVQLRGAGPRLDAQAIGFDPRNDIAVLRVPALAGAPALALDEGAGPGTAAAILGFPENGPFTVSPGRLGRTSVFLSQDAYGQGPIQRRITSLRGLVRSGNSGGPMVDSSGRVVATIFAATVGGGAPGGYGVPDSIVAAELGRAGTPVGTGPCAH